MFGGASRKHDAQVELSDDQLLQLQLKCPDEIDSLAANLTGCKHDKERIPRINLVSSHLSDCYCVWADSLCVIGFSPNVVLPKNQLAID